MSHDDEDRVAQAAWQRVAQTRRIIIKVGSHLLTGGQEHLQRDWIDRRCQEICAILDTGRQVVIVTSGAIAAGAARLHLGRKPVLLREKQAAAAAGQGVLMQCYEEAFVHHGRSVAQILLTREDVAHRRRYLNARDTLETLLMLGLVPIVNENDTVVVEEICFGENDTLAALVAGLIDADLLLLLSDIDGLYDGDPRQSDGQARLIPLVHQVTPDIERLAGGSGSQVGSGGMITKLHAARMAARSGCMTVIANGFCEGVIPKILSGQPSGTLFLSEGDTISSRKRWIANGLRSSGDLCLDEGAVSALLSGRSLLAKGIQRVQGHFDRGAAVRCLSPQGELLARGLVNYSADALRSIAGHHSSEFEAILGFRGDDEVIHRDNLVVLRV
ncbi:MAG: glutamate 5-kinase [Magnetococcales bacterium]|nr:glutamate 5-kinase [Magnetococcales bacterium]